MNKVEHIIKDIPPASRVLFEKYFLTLENQISDCLSRQQIIQGWMHTGLWPPNIRQIFSSWPKWDDLTCEDQDTIIEGVDLVALQMLGRKIDGYDADSDFEIGVADDSFMQSFF